MAFLELGIWFFSGAWSLGFGSFNSPGILVWGKFFVTLRGDAILFSPVGDPVGLDSFRR
jgi:hypothetical protein